jgi:hypothetical protein
MSSDESEQSSGDEESEEEEGCAHLRELQRKRAKLYHQVLVLTLALDPEPKCGPKGPNIKKALFSWAAHCRGLTPEQFKRRYRLSPQAFDALLARIRLHLVPSDVRQASRKGALIFVIVSSTIDERENHAPAHVSGTPILAETRLAVALRFLAGGMALDLSIIYHISLAEVYSTIWRVVDAINGALVVEFPLGDPLKLAQLEREFRAKSCFEGWEGQVGAVDGCHFKTISPGVRVPNPRSFFVARKDEFALLATAVCDADRRFLFWDINVTPTTHDSQSWALSRLGMAVADGELDSRYFIVGDSAYISSDQMIVPMNKPGGTHFDFVQSSNRMCIECAFGMLIRRWGILWRPIEVRADRRAKLISCCMRLHNYCIDSRISEENLDAMDGLDAMPVPPDGGTQERWVKTPRFKDGRPVDFLNAGGGGGGGAAESGTRAGLLRRVTEAGFQRPPRRPLPGR